MENAVYHQPLNLRPSTSPSARFVKLNAEKAPFFVEKLAAGGHDSGFRISPCV